MKPAIVVLAEAATVTARRIAAVLDQAEVLGLQDRVTGADRTFAHFGDTIRAL